MSSPLAGRAVFLLATPETGAERLLRALDCLPGVTSAPVPTHVVSQGIGSLLETWVGRTKDAMGDRADDQRFLEQARRLADAPLDAWRTQQGAEWVVEYSPDHIRHAPTLAVLYPDAQFVHVVRDGRQVACSLSSALLDWPPAIAARRWCEDQQLVAGLHGGASVHTVRVEDLVRAPAYYVDGLVERLGIDANPTARQRAVEVMGGGDGVVPTVPPGRPGTLVEAMGGDLLTALDYDVIPISALRRWSADVELGPTGDVLWALRAALRRFVAAARER